MVAQSLSLALSVVLAALVAQRVEAAPSAAAAIPTHVPTGDPKEECGSIKDFYHPYCCHYDGVLLPNPRQVDLDATNKEGYYYNAAGEFSDFTPLITANCHPKILTLLCFFYFPICMETQNELLSIFPCKSVCEEVTAPSSNCTKLLNSAGIPWGDHFNCSGYTYKNKPLYKDSQCVDNALERRTCPTRSDPTPTEEQPTTATTAEPTSAATTQAPTPDPEEACLADQQESCKKCRFRNALNGNTFVKNLNYNYAAKARFEGYTIHQCRRALNFTLERPYPGLKSSGSCLLTPPIPQSFLALGEHVYCEKDAEREENGCFKSHLTQKKGNPLEVGESYLVAGTYNSASGNWEALDRPLITLWDNKVDGRIGGAVSKGIDDRC